MVSASHPVLPFQLEDAARSEADAAAADEKKAGKGGKKEAAVIRVETDTRLDNRWIDLRVSFRSRGLGLVWLVACIAERRG